MMIDVNGKRLAVDDYAGAGGETLLLVHGLGGTANFWAPVVHAFAPMYRVLVPELPGAGRSPLDPDCSIESLAQDLLALLDALDVERVHVAGHSMGSIVCQHLAVLAPSRVRDLVLLGPLAELPDAARPVLEARAQAARDSGMEAIAAAVCERGLSPETRSTRPLVSGFVREMMIRQPAEGYAAHCLALARARRVPGAAITCPTLLLSGIDDTTAPPASVEALAASLTDVRADMLAGCGHWTAVEKPDEVVCSMQRFYRR